MLVGGPNGSGKTTLTQIIMDLDGAVGCYLNADTIARGLGGSALEASALAQIRVREERERALAGREDYCWETVMSHPSHIEHLEKARAKGCVTRLIYVATDDPRVNLARVAERVEDGGHDVPPDKTVERYFKSIANLPRAILASDSARIFDNSLPRRPFRMVATWDGDTVTMKMPYLEIPRWFLSTMSELQLKGVKIIDLGY